MGRRTAYLHIGLPRSGGDFLDTTLVEHAEALAEMGVRHPAISTEEMFRAAVEMRREHRAWGYRRREVEGTWAEICRRAHKGRGDVLLSQELLAGCTAGQVDLLLDTLGGFEVRAVLTARDPGSQLATAAGGEDPGEIAARWARALGAPDRVHVLVLPTGTDPRAAIWLGLADLVGFDASRLPLPQARVPSQVQHALARRLAVDPTGDEQLLRLAEGWRKELADGGYDVRGDTADLLPRPADEVDVPLDDRLSVTADALAHALVEVARLRALNQALGERNEKLERKRSKLKRRLVEAG